MAISGTAIVNVVPAGTVQPWRSNNFGGYADKAALLADRFNASSNPNGFWGPSSEDVNTGAMTLETSGGSPNGSSNFLRYTQSIQPQCHGGYTICLNAILPSAVAEVWIEVEARFSNGFVTQWNCATSAADYKFIFGRINGASSRFEIKAGTNGTQTGTNYPGGTTNNHNSPASSSYFDGQWHTWRMYCKAGASGAFSCWFDGTRFRHTASAPNGATSIYGISLGRNMNEGPLQVQTIDWGLIRYYNTDPGW